MLGFVVGRGGAVVFFLPSLPLPPHPFFHLMPASWATETERSIDQVFDAANLDCNWMLTGKEMELSARVRCREGWGGLGQLHFSFSTLSLLAHFFTSCLLLGEVSLAPAL